MSDAQKFKVYRGRLDLNDAGRRRVWDDVRSRFGFYVPIGLETHLGSVYFISGGPLVKIGFSTDLGQRLRDLQVGSPVPLTVEAHICGTLLQEYILHEVFRDYRRHGEWFLRSPPIETAIQQAKTNCEPEDIMARRLRDINREAQSPANAIASKRAASKRSVKSKSNVVSFDPRASRR